MTYTTSLGEGPDWCKTTHYYDGKIRAYNDGDPMHCKHEFLNSPGHKGGSTVDVDAFTFDQDDYWVVFDDRTALLQTKGVWTAVNNMEAAYCYHPVKDGKPGCTVVVEIS